MPRISRNHRQLNKEGFTFVELMIVSVIMMVLLGLSAPFVSSLRSEVALRSAIRQVKTDVITTMGYAMAGKSIAALSARQLNDPSLIPGYYGLHFTSGNDYGSSEPYYYLELSTQLNNQNMMVAKNIYQIEKEVSSPVVFLKDIRIKKNASDLGRSVGSVMILFTPPFGKVTFLLGKDNLVRQPGAIIGNLSEFSSNSDNRFIELEYQYKEDPIKSTVLTFGTDKVISIL